jgi:hypothetical protein
MALHLSDLRFQIYNAGLLGVGKEALQQEAKSGFLYFSIISMALNSISWLFKGDYRWTNWLATTSTDIVKAVLGSLAGILAGTALASGTVAIGSGIIIGVIVSIRLNSIDKRFEITKSLIKYLEYKERHLMKTTGEEIHRVYIATVSSFLKSIKVKARKDLNSFLSELVNPW